MVNPHQNVYQSVHEFKLDAAEALARAELCVPNEKRKRKCIPLDRCIKRAIENDADNDLLKSINVRCWLPREVKSAFSCVNVVKSSTVEYFDVDVTSRLRG